jgi:hypothetical protein
MSEGRRIYSFDETAFDVVREESAYWAGVLMADGSVVIENHRSPRIRLGFQTRDVGHLEKFKSFLKSGQPITTRMMPGADNGKGRLGLHSFSEFTVRSTALAKSLANYGVIPNKTYRTSTSPEIAANRHFWRGMIDGDGSIVIGSKTKTPQIFLLGSRGIVEQFLSFVGSSGISSTTRPYSKGKIWYAVISGRYAVLLAGLLYSDSSVALERKRSMAMKVVGLKDRYLEDYGIHKALTA